MERELTAAELQEWWPMSRVIQFLGLSDTRVRQLKLRKFTTPLGSLYDPEDVARYRESRSSK